VAPAACEAAAMAEITPAMASSPLAEAGYDAELLPSR
jgi:hypothetical protein